MITEISDAVIAHVTTAVPALQAGVKYPDYSGTTLLPAFVLDTNTEFTAAADEGAEQFCLTSAWRGYVVYDPALTSSYLQVRELVLSVSQAIYQGGRYGLQIGNAKIIRVYEEPMRTELAGRLVWAIDWTHDIRLGSSVWAGSGVLPSEVYFSFDPDAVPLGSSHTML
ncbi:MAG: hypothetical protein OEZ39_07475 [Gammaproteobacteria bacterium]|nr:hypothetical protein [Gammaproteobacteria bacterium]MDH5651698.1 hypothetical protein [Gammaproteobacteria bacterium]